MKALFAAAFALNLTQVSPAFSQVPKIPDVACWTSLYYLNDKSVYVKTVVPVKPSKTAPSALDGEVIVPLDRDHSAKLNLRVFQNRDSFTFQHLGFYTINIYMDAFEVAPVRSLGYNEGQQLHPSGHISCTLEGSQSHKVNPDGCSYADIRNVDVQSKLLVAKPGTAPVDLYKQGILKGTTPFSFTTMCKAWIRR